MAPEKKGTLQSALERMMSNTPKIETTKLPDEEPKHTPGKGFAKNAEWPTDIYIDDKKYPWLSKCQAGDEVCLIVRAKVDDITRRETESDEPKTSATLRLLEVGRFGGM